MIRIGIIDDHPIVVQGLRMVLDKSDIVCVDFVAASRKEALSLLFSKKPDIIFLDINLPDVNGVEFCRELKTKFPDLKIIALTSYTNKERVAMMLKAGAVGYITKNSPGDELIEGLITVSEGGVYLCKEVERIMNNIIETDSILSSREQEVLRLLANGLTKDQIAEKLFLSSHTIDSHRRNLFLKLEANNTPMLVRIAFEKGILN